MLFEIHLVLLFYMVNQAETDSKGLKIRFY